MKMTVDGKWILQFSDHQWMLFPSTVDRLSYDDIYSFNRASEVEEFLERFNYHPWEIVDLVA